MWIKILRDFCKTCRYKDVDWDGHPCGACTEDFLGFLPLFWGPYEDD